jgi:hypothetical protein
LGSRTSSARIPDDVSGYGSANARSMGQLRCRQIRTLTGGRTE